MKFTLLFLLLFSSLISYEYEHHSKKHIQKELSHLKLSFQQKKEIKMILKSFRKDLKEYGNYKKEIQKEKSKVFSKEILDVEKLNHLNNFLDKKAHNIENIFLQKIHKALNKKQRRKFIKYFDEWEVN
ncbi:MAG: hypothetical protein COB17_02840 [Sulfurimonas sp.]|nr:MAG: hypothetical protein COB17_02840 [Sulfurimonas sp.]